MLESVLVANRGEIARRVIRTARRMGIRTVAVYSDADAELPYVSEADQAVHIGPAQPARSYLDAAALIAAAHAIELRIYAEDPVRFLPGPGTITEWEEPAGDGVRVDAGYRVGNTVTPFYDPLLAKLCVHGADRAQALDRARAAVAAFRITGPKTNLPFHADLLISTEFAGGDYDTSLVSKLRPR